MDEINIYRFYDAINVHGITPRGGSWLNGCCPLAPITHASGMDSSPSFGVRIAPGEESHYFCFSCGASGSLARLLMELQPLAENDPLIKLGLAWELVNQEQEDMQGYHEAPEWKGIFHKSDFEAFPDWWLTKFLPWSASEDARQYLLGRNVPPKVADFFDLRYDSVKETVCFPYYNKGGLLAGMRGRYLQPDGKNKYHDYKFNNINNSSTVWYNEHRINWLKPIVIVEGAFDVLAVHSLWRNVMSPWSCTAKADMLRCLQKSVGVVCAFDHDTAGIRGFERIQKIMSEADVPVPLMVAFPPEGQDVAEMATGDLAHLLIAAGLPL